MELILLVVKAFQARLSRKGVRYAEGACRIEEGSEFRVLGFPPISSVLVKLKEGDRFITKDAKFSGDALIIQDVVMRPFAPTSLSFEEAEDLERRLKRAREFMERVKDGEAR